jgi:hypothetical protein
MKLFVLFQLHLVLAPLLVLVLVAVLVVIPLLAQMVLLFLHYILQLPVRPLLSM